MKLDLRRLFRVLLSALRRWRAVAQGLLWCRSTPLEADQHGLDLGCGPKKRPGFIGLDQMTFDGVDVICDFERGSLPFASGTFDIVYANHVLEHIHHLEDLLVDTSRVMKSGARLQIGVPYAGGLRAFQDPTHVRFFTLKTFEYFVREGSRVGGWYLPRCFRRISRRHLVFGKGPISIMMAMIVNRSLALLDVYEASILRVISARDLQVELEK